MGAAGDRAGRPLSRAGCFLLIATAFVLQILLYRQAFHILPAGDDFTTTYEIVRGEVNGPADFFTRSLSTHHYRPLKVWATWLLGSLSDSLEGRAFWLRVLHFGGMAVYAVAAGAWIRLLRVSLMPAAVATAVLFVHPVMTQALGSIDGVDTLVASGCMWIGAWACLAFRERIWLAVIVNLLCFAIGIGFKEATFAMVPLSAGTAFWFGGYSRWRAALVMAGALVGASLLIMVVRHNTIVATEAGKGFGYFRFRPAQLVENAVVLITGVLFFGNSLWVFLNRSPMVLAIVAASALGAVLFVAGGMWFLTRKGLGDEPRGTDATPHAGARHEIAGFPLRWWLSYFALTFLAASFPANIMYHVSEMYVPPIVLPFALLCGLATAGWAWSPKPLRLAASAGAVAAVVVAVLAVQDKVRGMVDVGRSADARLRQIASFVPPDLRHGKVLLLYRDADLPPKRTYAVFRIGDELIVDSEYLLEWALPGRGHRVTTRVVPAPDMLDVSGFDLALIWDARAGTYRRVSQPTSSPTAAAPACRPASGVELHAV